MAYTGATCATIFLITFNVITAIAGICLAAIGIWILADDSIIDLLDFVKIAHDDNLLKYTAILLIVVGFVALLIAIFGIVAAVNRNRCMLATYASILLLIMAAEIAGGVLAIVYKDEIIENLEEEALKELGDNELVTAKTEDGETVYEFTGFGGALSYVQYEFDCCGITTYEGYKDYVNWVNKTDDVDIQNWNVLPTCCVRDGNSDYKDLRKNPMGADDKTLDEYVDWTTCNSNAVSDAKYTNGCKDEMIDWFEDKAYVFIGCGIGIGCIQILGFILVICLCQYPRSKDYE